MIQLAMPTIFSTLDIISEYWQIPITEQDRDKTTFTCQSETCCLKRMPFRLMNACATFQRTSDILLRGHNRKTCLMCLDDFLISCKNFDELMGDIDNVLKFPQRARVSLKLKDCDFFKETVKYLGHVERPGQLAVDNAHIKILQRMQYSRTITELRSFLVLCYLYRRLILEYPNIATPSNKLLRKGMPTNPNPFRRRRESGAPPTD